jgi:Flp pilus assembly protein TadD
MTSDRTPGAPEPANLPQPREQGRFDWRRLAAGVVIIFLAVLAVYWRALRGQFLWDDFLVVHRNPLVTGELGLVSLWFRTDFPLTNVAFWLEWLAWGEHTLGYHVVNVLLHATSAVLLWRVLARLRVPAAWLAAMIFAVHPLCVASVAWISELKNTLSLPFYLLSILWYLRFTSGLRPSDFGLRTSKWYCLSLLAFALALLSKTSTVMLPVVLLGCGWWQRGRIERQDWLRTSPFFALALGFGLMSVGFQEHGAMAGVAVQHENFWGRLAGAGMALWFYLGKALLPLHLSMIYPRWKIDAGAPVSYLPLLLWCAVLAACCGARRNWGRHVLFGLGCFTVTLFPVLGFFDMYFLALSRVSDHFVYLPMTALVALAAAGLACVFKGRALRLAGVGLVVGLAVLATLRAPVFLSEEALWRDTVAKNPAAWCAHANLGWILASQEKYDEAREHLVASLAVKPDNAQAHSNLGRVLSLQGKFAEADGQFQAAVGLKPKDAEIRRSYASFLAEQGRREDAVKQLRELLQLKPDTEARVQLATLLYQRGKPREAVAEYRQVLAAKPDQPEALRNLAWLLATNPDGAVRDGADAVRFAERGCLLTNDKQAQMLGTLAAAYAETGRFADAVATAQKAIELARADGDTRFAAVNEQLLRLYRAGKPYHEPPPKVPLRGPE